MFENPYKILNINDDSTIEEVKKAYRKIALKSHPDKLNNIKDNEEKNIKIKEFTEATNAYNQILNNEDLNININYNNWEETFDYIINSQLFKDFINVMTKNNNIITHSFNLDITYSDYYSKNKISYDESALRNFKGNKFFLIALYQDSLNKIKNYSNEGRISNNATGSHGLHKYLAEEWDLKDKLLLKFVGFLNRYIYLIYFERKNIRKV